MACLRGSRSYVWNTADVLGRGATADVYIGREKRTGEEYAIKCFNHMANMRPMSVQMRELEVLQKLNHKNIVRLLAIEEEATSRSKVIVMELCTGGSLFNVLDDPVNAYGLEEDEFLKVLQHVTDGMKHLREQGMCHRDIKPANIMRHIEEDGTTVYKLTDFGAARELKEEEQFMSLYGTEEYLHPDMYERAVLRIPGGKMFDATVDLWSIGVTVYHAATGQLPFRPFGGRKNRETMYEITAKKRSGVISGVQSYDRGPITWSTELPSECRLSSGLKKLITPVIAYILESDENKLCTFDKFFADVHAILEKKVVHVFNAADEQLHHIYIEPGEKYAGLQDLIAAQTDVRANDQILLMDCQPLQQIVCHNTPLGQYPETRRKKPVYLFNKNITDKQNLYQCPTVSFPPISTSISTTGVNVDADYLIAKGCLGVIFALQRNTKDYVLCMKLADQAILEFTHVFMNDIQEIKKFLDFFKLEVRETQKRVPFFIENHEIQIRILDRFAMCFPDPEIKKEIQEARKDLDDLVFTIQQEDPQMNRICEKEDLRLHKFCQKFEGEKVLAKQWNQGAVLKDIEIQKWEEKMKSLSVLMKNLMDFFLDHKRHKRLNYNEEQIHKMERQRMKEKCTKVMSVLDHCYSTMSRQHTRLQGWVYEMNLSQREYDTMKSEMLKMSECRKTFSNELDEAQVQYKNTLDKIVYQLEKASLPTISNTPPKKEVQNPPPRTPKGKKKELIKDLNRDLVNLTKDTSDLRSLVDENKVLLEQVQRLSLQSCDNPPNFGGEDFDALEDEFEVVSGQ